VHFSFFDKCPPFVTACTASFYIPTLEMRDNIVTYSVAEGACGGEAFLDAVAASMARLRHRCECDCGLPADAAISFEVNLDIDRLKR
jgi:hypothetical protein